MKKLLSTTTLILAITALNVVAAISIGPGGTSGTVTFADATPPPLDEWATRSIGGGSGDYATTVALDDAVNLVAASTINTNFPTTATVPPGNRNLLARYNTGGQYLQTFPTGNGATLVMATVTNGTGQAATTFTLTYDLTNPTTATGNEGNLPGHRVYFSFTGLPQSWQPIPGLSGSALPGAKSGSFNLGNWPDGAPIYIVWADDNGDGDDPCWTIDNVVFGAKAEVVPLSITLTSPANGESFATCSRSLRLQASITGVPTYVTYYMDWVEVAARDAVPFSPVTLSPGLVTEGPHTFYATVWDVNGESASSPDVSIVVTAAPPVSIVITNVFSGTVTGLVHGVGSCVEVQYGFTGLISNVDLFLDDRIYAQIPIGAGHNQGWIRCNDMLAGAHSLVARALDNCGNAYVSSTVTVEITNPAPPTVVLVPNGSTWKYHAANSEPPTNALRRWFEKDYDDTAWPSGAGELGNGDYFNGTDPVNPEATAIDIGPGGDHYLTIYFRHAFTANPSQYDSLILNLLRDDGAVVWLNGKAVWTNEIIVTTSEIVYTNLANTAADDGTGYHQFSLPASDLISGANANVLAVEVHQTGAGSSDLSFDLMLWGVTPAGPTLAITQNPATGNVEIAWPDAGYKLQYADQVLGSGTGWTDVPGNPQNFYEVPAGPGPLFYRLTQ